MFVRIPQLDSVRQQPRVRELRAIGLKALQVALCIGVGALIDQCLDAVAQQTLRACVRTTNKDTWGQTNGTREMSQCSETRVRLT